MGAVGCRFYQDVPRASESPESFDRGRGTRPSSSGFSLSISRRRAAAKLPTDMANSDAPKRRLRAERRQAPQRHHRAQHQRPTKYCCPKTRAGRAPRGRKLQYTRRESCQSVDHVALARVSSLSSLRAYIPLLGAWNESRERLGDLPEERRTSEQTPPPIGEPRVPAIQPSSGGIPHPGCTHNNASTERLPLHRCLPPRRTRRGQSSLSALSSAVLRRGL